MSFLAGFAEAYTDDMESKRKDKRTKEAYKFQVDYRMSQENAQAEKKRDTESSTAYDKGVSMAKMYGHPKSVQKMIGDAARNGATDKQLDYFMTQGTWSKPDAVQDPKMETEMKAALGAEKVVDPLSVEARNRATPAQEARADSAALSATTIAKQAGVKPEALLSEVGGIQLTNTQALLQPVFTPDDPNLQKAMMALPETADEIEEVARRYDSLNTSKGDIYAANARQIASTVGKDHSIKDGYGYMVDDKGTYVKGKMEDGEFYPNGEDKPISPGSLQTEFFDNRDKLEKNEQTILYRDLNKLSKSKSALKAGVRDRAIAIGIVNQHPEALTTVTGVAGGIQRLAVEFNSIITTTTGLFTDDKDWQAKWTGISNQFINNPAFESVPGARELSRVQLRLAFSELQSLGQTGQGASNRDVENILKNMFPANPANFANHVAKGFASQLNQVETERSGFIDTHGSLLARSYTHNKWLDNTISDQLQMNTEDTKFNTGLQALLALSDDADGTIAIQKDNEAIREQKNKTPTLTFGNEGPSDNEYSEMPSGTEFLVEGELWKKD